MIELQSIADLELLRESVDLECKLALGRDGQGALAEDFWRPYRALGMPEGGAGYCLPGAAIPKPEEVFGAASEQLLPSSPDLAASCTLAGWR